MQGCSTQVNREWCFIYICIFSFVLSFFSSPSKQPQPRNIKFIKKGMQLNRFDCARECWLVAARRRCGWTWRGEYDRVAVAATCVFVLYSFSTKMVFLTAHIHGGRCSHNSEENRIRWAVNAFCCVVIDVICLQVRHSAANSRFCSHCLLVSE